MNAAEALGWAIIIFATALFVLLFGGLAAVGFLRTIVAIGSEILSAFRAIHDKALAIRKEAE